MSVNFSKRCANNSANLAAPKFYLCCTWILTVLPSFLLRIFFKLHKNISGDKSTYNYHTSWNRSNICNEINLIWIFIVKSGKLRDIVIIGTGRRKLICFCQKFLPLSSNLITEHYENYTNCQVLLYTNIQQAAVLEPAFTFTHHSEDDDPTNSFFLTLLFSL